MSRLVGSDTSVSAGRQTAEQIVLTARQLKNTPALADALTALGKVQMLQGDAAALATLAAAEALTAGDPVRQFRVLTFSRAARLLLRYTYPDGMSTDSTTKEWVDVLVTYQKKVNPLKDGVDDPGALLEKEVVFHQFETMPQQRQLVRPSSISGTASTSEATQWTIEQELAFREKTAANSAVARLLPHIDLGLAELCRLIRRDELARKHLSWAHAGYQHSNDLVGVAACFLAEGDWAAAPLSTPVVMNFHIATSQLQEHSNPHWALEAEELDTTRRDLTLAKQRYREAQRLFEQAGAKRGLAALSLRRSYLASAAGDYAGAKQNAQEALTGFAEAGDRLGWVSATAHLLLARVGAGELPEDREAAAAIGRWGVGDGSLGHALGIGLMIGRASRHWLLRDGDYERALAGYRLAESLYEALGTVIRQAQTAVDEGSLLSALGEDTAAITLFEQAIRLYQADSAEDHQDEDWVRNNAFIQLLLLHSLFMLHLNRDDPDAMERVAGELRDLSRLPAPDPRHVPAAFAQAPALAPMEAVKSQFVQELVHYQYMIPALRLRKARERGDVAGTAHWLDVALAAARESSPGQRSFNEAIVYAYAHDYSRATQSFQRYLDGGGPNSGSVGGALKLMSTVGGQPADRELQLQERRTHQQALAFFRRVNAYEEARTHLDALESLAGKDWWRSEEKPWEALNEYGAIYEGLGHLEEAAAYYDQAVGQLEARRQRLGRDQFKTALAGGMGAQAIYLSAARTALKSAEQTSGSGDDTKGRELRAKALGYAERGKARGLLDLMASGAANSNLGPNTSAAVRAWHQTNAKLSAWRSLLAAEQGQPAPSSERITYLNGRITEDEASLRQTESALAQDDPGFYAAINPQAAVLDTGGIAARLPDGTALIQYCFGSEDLMIWGVTRDGAVRSHRAAVDGDRLNRQIESYRRACEQRATLDGLGEELSRLLLAPLADLIEAHSQLILVPYGKAHSLPFSALPWNGQPLVAGRTVSYLPSASTLQFVQPGRPMPSADRLLAVGNPSRMAWQPRFTGQAIPQPSLHAAAREARFVASLFPRGRALIGDQAAKPAVLDALGHYPLLHFATHGVLSEDSPLLSSILLANGESLTVYDLMGARMNADLVVLSACRTAQGEATRGDDVLGLTRGLLAAGARATLATLWPVDDLATSMLMEQFYRHLRQGTPAAAALQNAQNELRTLSVKDIQQRRAYITGSLRGTVLTGEPAIPFAKDYRDPFFWAPFVLVG